MKEIMALSLTLFKSIFDNKTDKVMNFSDFPEFEKFLYKLSNIPRVGKRNAPLISPASFKKDTTRKNDSVISWCGWAAVDVDDHQIEGDLKETLAKKYGDWYYVCYSTASSTKEFPKFRLIFPLKCHVEASKIKAFWYALNSELESIGDRQTKDLSRMYYVPADYKNANNFIFTNVGQYIDPYALIDKHPTLVPKGNNFFDRLPSSMQEMILQHRKDQMDNRTISWNSYRNCPFINKKLVAEYRTISSTGWYHKMYQIMVSTAGNAVKQKYPITAMEIAELCKELDVETGGWYGNRPLNKEAEGAIEFIYKNM
jgi:hypothetical protein